MIDVCISDIIISSISSSDIIIIIIMTIIIFIIIIIINMINLNNSYCVTLLWELIFQQWIICMFAYITVPYLQIYFESKMVFLLRTLQCPILLKQPCITVVRIYLTGIVLL